MSYDILYDIQGVKTSRGITPLVLAGDNRTWSCSWNGHSRRARSWSILYNIFDGTEEALIHEFEERCGDEYQEHFMRNGKWVNDIALMSIARNCIKNARTIEEINAIDPRISLYCSIYGDKDSETVYIHSTIELEEWINKAKPRISELSSAGEIVFPIMRFNMAEPLKLGKKTALAGKCILKYRGNYVIEITESHISSSRDKSKAMVFDSFESLEKYSWWKKNSWGVKAIAYKEPKPEKPKEFYIMMKGDLYGNYVLKLSRGGLHYTRRVEQAKKFATEKNAIKYIKEHNLEGRFKSEYEVKHIS